MKGQFWRSFSLKNSLTETRRKPHDNGDRASKHCLKTVSRRRGRDPKLIPTNRFHPAAIKCNSVWGNDPTGCHTPALPFYLTCMQNRIHLPLKPISPMIRGIPTSMLDWFAWPVFAANHLS